MSPSPARVPARVIETPVGPWLAVLDGAGRLCRFSSDVRDRPPPDDHPVLVETERQVTDFFARRRTGFDLPLAPEGTEFQQTVWAQLLQIPYGRTISYGTLAARLGKPGAMRAVGQANHVNPIGLIIPCHRVIGADGSLTGFGGGIALKQALLEFESPPAQGVLFG